MIADIKFNPNFPWGTDGSSNSYDVQNVGTHELGHSVGLADLYGAADSEKTMYGYSDKGETKQRTLDQDDINGIIYLYGNNNSSTSSTTTASTTSSTSSIKTTTIPTTTISVSTTTSIAPVREVDFTGFPVSGSTPLTVTFNNRSRGDITYRRWEFGDGSPVSFDSSPVHKYRKSGMFTVTLVVGFVDGSTKRMLKENYISVKSQCLFVSALENQAQINKIRQLRTALRDNLYWQELSVIYYRNFFEVMLILRQCPELRDEFQRLVSNQDLAKAFAEGFVYSGAYSPARRRRHGNTSKDLAAPQFVVCAQNHDQVGNRLKGDRLSPLVSFEGLKLAAAVVLLSPFIPLLFMGEEYGETAPFPYFVSHSDPGLIEVVRRGRREDFPDLEGPDKPPDAQEEATRQSARLDHRLRHQGQHRLLYGWYQELIKLRNETRAGAGLSNLQQRRAGAHHRGENP